MRSSNPGTQVPPLLKFQIFAYQSLWSSGTGRKTIEKLQIRPWTKYRRLNGDIEYIQTLLNHFQDWQWRHSAARISVSYSADRAELHHDHTVSSKQEMGWVRIAKIPFPKLSRFKAASSNKTINRRLAARLPLEAKTSLQTYKMK
jgi:hypothetical protein